MKKMLLLRSLGALIVAGLGTAVAAQDDDDSSSVEQRRVRIEITRNENGQKSHITREFDLNDAQQLQDALKELGVLDEMNVIGDGENLVIDMRRMRDGGLLNDMSMALSAPDVELSDPQAYLGVYYGPYKPSDLKGDKNAPPVKKGARVTDVEDGTAAQKAGLQEGDVIVELGGHAIDESDDLIDAIGNYKPGDRVNVVFYRGRTKKNVQVTLGERERGHEDDNYSYSFNWDGDDDEDAPDEEAAPSWGMGKDRAFLGVVGGSSDDDAPGVHIGEVVDSSAAQGMGLQEGDVIKAINGDKVADFGELSEKIGDMEPEQDVTIDLDRNGKAMQLKGKLGRKRTRNFTWNGLVSPMPPTPPMPPMPPGGEGSRDQDELRREMDQLRREMDRLRHDLRSDVTKEMRITIDEVKLSKEETDLLKSNGVPTLDQPLDLHEMRCYPNPSSGSFHIEFQVPERGDLTVDVHDSKGERVYHETITGFKGSYERTLDMSDRPNGTYFLVITQGGKSQARKLVKQ